MSQNQLTKNLEVHLQGKISEFLDGEDLTPYETPLKKGPQIKKEIEHRFIDFVYGMSQSIKHAETLIHRDLHLVATPEEVTVVNQELSKIGDNFLMHINKEEGDEGVLMTDEQLTVESPHSLQEMVAISNHSMLLFYKLAIHYNENHEYGKNKDILHLLLCLNARVSTYWVAMGACCQAQHKHSEALTYFKGGSEANPQNPAPHFYAAACYCEMNHLDEAKLELSAAEKLVSHLPDSEQSKWNSWKAYLHNKIRK